MYAPQPPGDFERTAFRKAEKKYKLYKTVSKKSRQKAVETDLSEVFDFKLILESFNLCGETPPGIFKLKCDFCRPVFGFEDRPGFYFIPGALSTEEQCHWVRESLTRFPHPPNRTNHNAIYGPIYDLFTAVQNERFLVAERNSREDMVSLPYSNGPDAPRGVFKEKFNLSEGDMCNSIAASLLLRKLRWSTLGLQFDWSKRNYDVCLPHNKIPDTLCQLAKKMATPAMSGGTEFQPEAAIVNYFSSGDMLGGHLDDMEADWSKPIVSISLGCKAVFLLGGKSREDSPVAMFLRSGDIVLMAGQARECFHGKSRTCLVGFALPYQRKVEKFDMDWIQLSCLDVDDSGVLICRVQCASGAGLRTVQVRQSHHVVHLFHNISLSLVANQPTKIICRARLSEKRSSGFHIRVDVSFSADLYLTLV